MHNVTGHKLLELPIFELRKISDLIEFDGAILSHFIDKKENNYLYYWTDQNEDFNRWLIWRIDKNDLFEYLRGKLSLREILLNRNKEFIYSVDINRELEYKNITAIEIDDCPSEYLPEKSSYFYSEFPELYKGYFNYEESSLYLEYLNELALFFRIKPPDLEFASTVRAIDAANFLKKLNTSFLNFLEDNFFEKYKTQITDYTKLKKIINEFKRILTPRVSHLKYSSFEVGLSVDPVKSIGSGLYKEWQRNIFIDFKENVVDKDYTSEEVLMEIKKTHSEEYIQRVILPFIEAVNTKEYKVESFNIDKTFSRTYKEISKQNKELITPQRVLLEEKEEKRNIYNIVVELSKGQDISQVSGKKIQTGLLFSQLVEKIEIPLLTAENEGVFLKFKPNTNYLFSVDSKNYYCCEIPIIDFILTAKNKPELDKYISIELANLFIYLSKALREEDKIKLNNFIQLVESIEYKNKK